MEGIRNAEVGPGVVLLETKYAAAIDGACDELSRIEVGKWIEKVRNWEITRLPAPEAQLMAGRECGNRKLVDSKRVHVYTSKYKLLPNYIK